MAAAGDTGGGLVTWGNNSTFQILIIQGTQSVTGLFLYNGLGSPTNPPQFAAVASGVTTDPFGNAITSSKILVQGNVITESGGIFRTAAAAPLIQLDGIHNAYLEYNAASGLSETIAPVTTSDGLGSTALPGFTSYTTTTPFIALQLAQQVIQWWSGAAQGGPWTADRSSLTDLAGALSILSGTRGGASQAQIIMSSGATAPQSQIAMTSPTSLGNLSSAPSVNLTNNGSILWASGGHLKTVSTSTGGDGGTYGTERAVFTATGQLVNSLTPATIAGIGVTIPVAAAKYLVRGCIIILQGAGGAGSQGARFVGPAISNMNVSFLCTEAASIFNSGVIGALNTDMSSGPIPINTTAELHFDGIITFSAAGSTFGMQADCITSATDTWTLSGNSYLELLPL